MVVACCVAAVSVVKIVGIGWVVVVSDGNAVFAVGG